MNCITTKVDEPTLNLETDTYIENNKEISSPTQPKTLQQEFSLININIPNIEVIIYIDIIEIYEGKICCHFRSMQWMQ